MCEHVCVYICTYMIVFMDTWVCVLNAHVCSWTILSVEVRGQPTGVGSSLEKSEIELRFPGLVASSFTHQDSLWVPSITFI